MYLGAKRPDRHQTFRIHKITFRQMRAGRLWACMHVGMHVRRIRPKDERRIWNVLTRRVEMGFKFVERQHGKIKRRKK